MPRDTALARARERIAREFEQRHGLEPEVEEVSTEIDRGDGSRTGLQRLIEASEGLDLQEVLRKYSTLELARKYRLDKSTVSRWKERSGWTRGMQGKLEPPITLAEEIFLIDQGDDE